MFEDKSRIGAQPRCQVRKEKLDLRFEFEPSPTNGMAPSNGSAYWINSHEEFSWSPTLHS